MGTFLSSGSKDSYASLKLLPTLAIPGRLIPLKWCTLLRTCSSWKRRRYSEIFVRGLSTSNLRNNEGTVVSPRILALPCKGLALLVDCIVLILNHSVLLGVLKWNHLSPARLVPKHLFVFLSVTVYSLDGILVFGLLFVCTCAYFKKVPRLKTWLLSEKKGVWGVFYKGMIISGQGEEIAISGQWGATKCRGVG